MADFDFTLNPYSGCEFGCSYCYAAFFVPTQKREAWGRWVEAKTSTLAQLERRIDLGGKHIYMSSVTDPYQPLESKLCLTRSALEFLSRLDSQPRLVIQTRSPLVTRDIDLLQRFEHLRVNVTVPTDDDAIRKRFEPGCPSIDRRFDTIVTLVEAGVRVAICVSPMLPIRDLDVFITRLASIVADRYVIQPFKPSHAPYAAATRKMALDIASEFGWTRSSYDRAANAFKRRLSPVLEGKAGFGPV